MVTVVTVTINRNKSQKTMTESQWVAELVKHLVSVFDILQGAIQLGVAASGVEDFPI